MQNLSICFSNSRPERKVIAQLGQRKTTGSVIMENIPPKRMLFLEVDGHLFFLAGNRPNGIWSFRLLCWLLRGGASLTKITEESSPDLQVAETITMAVATVYVSSSGLGLVMPRACKGKGFFLRTIIIRRLACTLKYGTFSFPLYHSSLTILYHSSLTIAHH